MVVLMMMQQVLIMMMMHASDEENDGDDDNDGIHEYDGGDGRKLVCINCCLFFIVKSINY